LERNHAFSSLLRCGTSLETVLWDLGERGRSQSLLVVYNPVGLQLKKNARLMQLAFLRLENEAEKCMKEGISGRTSENQKHEK